MKTLNFLNSKKCALFFALFISNLAAKAQDAVVPQKSRKLQIGVFAEGQKEFETPKGWHSENIAGYTAGVAFRHLLSNNFSVSAGLGASLSTFAFREAEFYSGFAASPYEMIGYKKTETLLRLPLSLQANIYKQKFYATGGIEIFKVIDNIVIHTNKKIATNEIVFEGYNYGSTPLDIQFTAGFGWNFKALSNNLFSLESQLKYFTPLGDNVFGGIGRNFTPSLRLNWYFIK